MICIGNCDWQRLRLHFSANVVLMEFCFWISLLTVDADESLRSIWWDIPWKTFKITFLPGKCEWHFRRGKKVKVTTPQRKQCIQVGRTLQVEMQDGHRWLHLFSLSGIVRSLIWTFVYKACIKRHRKSAILVWSAHFRLILIIMIKNKKWPKSLGCRSLWKTLWNWQNNPKNVCVVMDMAWNAKWIPRYLLFKSMSHSLFAEVRKHEVMTGATENAMHPKNMRAWSLSVLMEWNRTFPPYVIFNCVTVHCCTFSSWHNQTIIKNAIKATQVSLNERTQTQVVQKQI